MHTREGDLKIDHKVIVSLGYPTPSRKDNGTMKIALRAIEKCSTSNPTIGLNPTVDFPF